jgi:hypothetical protein
MRIKHWFYTAPLRLRSLLRRSQVEEELDEELRYHIERQVEEHIAKGMTPEEARYAALRAMGGVEQRKEECRDMRRVTEALSPTPGRQKTPTALRSSRATTCSRTRCFRTRPGGRAGRPYGEGAQAPGRSCGAKEPL